MLLPFTAAVQTQGHSDQMGRGTGPWVGRQEMGLLSQEKQLRPQADHDSLPKERQVGNPAPPLGLTSTTCSLETVTSIALSPT